MMKFAFVLNDRIRLQRRFVLRLDLTAFLLRINELGKLVDIRVFS